MAYSPSDPERAASVRDPAMMAQDGIVVVVGVRQAPADLCIRPSPLPRPTLGGLVRQSQRQPIPWLGTRLVRASAIILVLVAVAATAAAAGGPPSPTHRDPSSTAGGLPATPIPIPSRVQLHPRAEASETHINEPPTPPGGFPPPLPRPSTTTSRPRSTTNRFAIRPPGDDDLTNGQGPRPTGLDAAARDPRDGWNIVPVMDPHELTKATSASSTSAGNNRASIAPAVNTRDPFHNIWAPTNIPQPGDSITTDPPASSTQPPSPQPSPTTPTGPSVSLPGLPTATPNFSAIPIVPIGIAARTHSPDPASDPPLPNPIRHMEPFSCGTGYCTPDETCSTCPFDCSLAHLDYVRKRRYDLKHQFLFGTLPRSSENITRYTFECGLPHVAQFCPRAPGTNRTRAMVAVTGYHPGPFTNQIQNALKGVPPAAVIVFLDLAVLMSVEAESEAAAAACNLVLERKMAVGISLGSALFEMVDGMSAASVSLAATVLQALPDWCAQRARQQANAIHLCRSLGYPCWAPPPPDPNRPLFISLDPGSAYRAAVLDNSIPSLLASFNARIVVPSLPISEAYTADRVVNAPETSAHHVKTTISLRAGISGWIVGFDGSNKITSSLVIPRVVQELETLVEWVSDVGECLEYDAKADAKRAPTRMAEGVKAVKEKVSKSKSPVLRPTESTEQWAMETSVWGAEVDAVSMDDSHMPGGFFS